MAVTVKLPGVLRAEAGGAAAVQVAAHGSLRAALDALDEVHPRLGRRLRDEQGTLRRYVNVYIDGEDCRALGGLDTPVPDGAEILVMPSVAGG